MTTVFNVIQSPDGEALSGQKVEVKLVFNKAVQAVAKDDSNSVMLMGRYATVTDSNGRWSVDLVATSDISPASVYQVTERVPPGKQAVTYFFEVPDELATPVDQWLGDLLVDRPSYA